MVKMKFNQFEIELTSIKLNRDTLTKLFWNVVNIGSLSVVPSTNLVGGFDCQLRCFFGAGGERSRSSQTRFSSRSDSRLSNSSKWRLFLNFVTAFRNRSELRDQQIDVHGAVTNFTTVLCDRSMVFDASRWKSKQSCWLDDVAWGWGFVCFLEGVWKNHASTAFVLQTCRQNEDTTVEKRS